MPWTVADPPSVAKNWTRAERYKCVKAANAVLRDKKWDDAAETQRKAIEKQAIFACIRAAGKSKKAGQEEITVNELGTQLHNLLAPLFLSARAILEEDTPSLDAIVDIVRYALDRMRWKMLDEVDFFVLEIRPEYVIVSRWIDDSRVFFKVPYTLDRDGYDAQFGDWEQIVEVREYRTLEGETLEEAAERVGMVLEEENLLEGWLPAGTSQNDLDDGDFAWLSNAYRKASKDEKTKMNKGDSRKLPYKIHGTVNRDGWKAAWKAVTGGGTRGLKSYAGGPNKSQVLAKLKRDKPKGIQVNKDNTFVDKGNTEEAWATEPGRTLLLTVEDTPIVEETGVDERDDRPYLIYRGTALVDNAISGNNKFYDADSNARIMAATNQYLEEGGIVTVYSRHGKAVPGPLGDLPVGLPVGKVIAPLWREDDRVHYKARISGTSEGQDVMILIEDEVMKFTSIRSRPGAYKLVPKKVNGRQVEAVVEATIHGIDLADAAGIEGAGIDEILSEELVIETIQEDKTMDWNVLNLEELRTHRPDLVEAILKDKKLGEEVTTLTAQLSEEQAARQKAEAALAQAKSEHEAAVKSLAEEKDAKIAELTGELDRGKLETAIARAVEGKEHTRWLRQYLTHGFMLVEEQDGKPVETWLPGATSVEDVTERLPKAEAAIKALVEEFGKAGNQPGDSFRGTLHTQSDGGDEGNRPASGNGPLTEETMAEVQRLAAG